MLHKGLKKECEKVKNDSRSGSPSTSQTEVNVKHVRQVVWLGSVGFDDTLTTVGYLMPNPVYTYILNIYMICEHIVICDKILKRA